MGQGLTDDEAVNSAPGHAATASRTAKGIAVAGARAWTDSLAFAKFGESRHRMHEFGGCPAGQGG
ncbi:hypothetical protein GCM10010245_89880 [Streptomyces spectabilis]|nr:hypothetical protein GCM10010245_89880 [Streptomyces spectabilis]